MQSSVRSPQESTHSDSTLPFAARTTRRERRWFDSLSRAFGSKPSPPPVASPDADPLLAFACEAASEQPAMRVSAGPMPVVAITSGGASITRARLLTIVAVVMALATVGVFATRRAGIRQFTPVQPETGTLKIVTRPAAAELLIDGERRGLTPLTLALAPGEHTITIRHGSDERIVPLTIASGADLTHYFELEAAAPPVTSGRLSVVTDPPGAVVSIDGRPRGTSPVTVADLTAHEHRVSVTANGGSAERTVAIAAGGTTSVMFSLPKVAGPVAGWLSITSPFDVDVVEHDDVIGTSATTRIMLAAGRHDVVLANANLGYQAARTIEVTPGKTSAIRVEPPQVSVNVNARPWAEVILDGNSMGQTPLANMPVAVGPHEIVFRHPQFAERKQSIVVTAHGPNRIAADLTK